MKITYLDRINQFLFAVLSGASSLVFLSSGNIELSGVVTYARYAIVAMVLVLIYVINHKNTNLATSPHFLPSAFWWYVFGLCVVASGLINSGLSGCLKGGWFLVGIPFFFFIMIPRAFGPSAASIINRGLIWGHMPYIIISLVTTPISLGSYYGVCGNPNSMGLVCAIVIIATVLETVDRDALQKQSQLQRRVTRILNSTMTVIAVVVLLATASRLALIASVISVLTILACNSRHKISSMIGSFVFVASLTVVGYFVIPNTDVSGIPVIGEMLNKTARSMNEGEYSTGRFELWQDYWAITKPFGVKQKFIDREFEQSTHNAFLNVAVKYGWVSLIPFVLFFGAFCFKVIGAVFRSFDQSCLIHVGFATLFLVEMSAEGSIGLLGSGLWIAMYCLIGHALSLRNEPPRAP